MLHKTNAAKPRLSDEELDPLEADDINHTSTTASVEGWHPWTSEDLIDIRRIIEAKLPTKQKEVIEAFLSGENYETIGVTEKYYRYHLHKAVEFIQKEMGL